MAKIVIAGDAVVVASAMKLEDIKLVQKYRPGELVLKGGEDGKEPIFAVTATEAGSGSANEYGVSFAHATNDEEKLACVTMVVTGKGDIKEFVADQLGPVVTNLNKLEAKLPAVIEEIRAEKAAVLESISVIQ